MAVNGGLKVMLNRLAHVKDTIRSKQLLIVLLKLFGHCVRVKQAREKLLDPDLKTIPILLKCVTLCLSSGKILFSIFMITKAKCFITFTYLL
jgi:hypothetical protein